MPYSIRKQDCKQSDGDSGSYVLSYTDKKGKKHRNCHTSKKKAQGQIAAIEMRKESQSYSNIAGRRTFFYNPAEGLEDAEENFQELKEQKCLREMIEIIIQEIIYNEV